MHAAATGGTQKEDREEDIDKEDIFEATVRWRCALPQKKIFHGQHRSWPQTEAQETDDIDQQRQQRANEMQHMME
jgi:hypothetical protein